MIRHIVAWNLADNLSDAEKRQTAEKIKAELEALPQYIEGIVELKVHIDTLPLGNRDIVLNSAFVSEEALVAYQAHPEHKRAGGFVASVTKDRACIDYRE